ncbi:hypothetical protein J0A68_19405 [Algoriphagus sp. H41]|uniref:PepSY domain-containing protein n=1 Tax=Algoriphagus oliviformis TaxID=2811231 RepID=A0ABS3C9A1_9BACT|nr:hypothetical protein [Algoriphagus oliviformis]MBN7813131.1 hypothetical protein [Algoriphagus oliviformis]
MKKLNTLLLLLGLLAGVLACTSSDGEDPLDVFREIAYNALSSSQKATINSNWQEAEVGAWVDGNYVVVFESTDPTLADLRVIVDPVNGRVVEILPRN